MRVPPNHPFIDGLSIYKPSSFGGYPHDYGNALTCSSYPWLPLLMVSNKSLLQRFNGARHLGHQKNLSATQRSTASVVSRATAHQYLHIFSLIFINIWIKEKRTQRFSEIIFMGFSMINRPIWNTPHDHPMPKTYHVGMIFALHFG